MPAARLIALIALVILAAAATLALAWGVAGIGAMPLWQAAIGPVLLAAVLALRLFRRGR